MKQPKPTAEQQRPEPHTPQPEVQERPPDPPDRDERALLTLLHAFLERGSDDEALHRAAPLRA